MVHDRSMAVLTLPVGDENTWLGAFGESWFHALCMVAGCPAPTPKPDAVGTDFFVADHGSETIRVQVKTTESPRIVGSQLSFPLDVPTYNRLRVGSTLGYLVVVVMHEPHPRWTGHSGRGSIVRATGYVALLSGMGGTRNTSSITIRLRLSDILTPVRLMSLFP